MYLFYPLQFIKLRMNIRIVIGIINEEAPARGTRGPRTPTTPGLVCRSCLPTASACAWQLDRLGFHNFAAPIYQISATFNKYILVMLIFTPILDVKHFPTVYMLFYMSSGLKVVS